MWEPILVNKILNKLPLYKYYMKILSDKLKTEEPPILNLNYRAVIQKLIFLIV